jgi:hypothetical protein
MTRGFVIMAQNSDTVDYVKCATALEKSIKRVMPNANVTIITTDMLPYGDKGGFANDWQVYEASPYDETIKLEADMYIPRSIEHWWDVLKEISSVRFYRRFIDDNNLPDTYNAITYFKKSEKAKKFFDIVKDIFENWEEYRTILKCTPQEQASTDWVYALASHIMGAEETTMPAFTEMSMIHMKMMINGITTENWTDSLVYECLPDHIRVSTEPQMYPFHYHVKNFADKILKGLHE